MTTVCGALDVGDRRRLIPADPVPTADLKCSAQAAFASPFFDGVETPVTGSAGAFYGRRTVVKLQHRTHERHETALRFERLRTEAGIKAPRLLDTGIVETASGPIWWAVLERRAGEPSDRPTAAQQDSLGRQFRRWHTYGRIGGLRLDDPGALGVLLGTARRFAPAVYPALSEEFAAACEGLPLTAVHGDLAVGHNALFEGDVLTAVLDPGGVDCGPPMLDLAWALAVDMPHGGRPEPLLEGYGATDAEREALDGLLPLMMARHLVDTTILRTMATDGRWIADWLRHHDPRLLQLIAGALGF